MNNKWYKQRTYAHFDRPLSKKQAHALVSDPQVVAEHAFWPLLVAPLKSVYKQSDKSGRRKFTTKKRPIAFSAHSDSHIYSYYAWKIGEALETIYEEFPLCGESVLAYRKFPIPKSNINFSIEAFDEIKNAGECEVIALDVEGFFDNLDAQILKRKWCELLGVDRLPADHFAVFKACTRSYGVTVAKIRDLFKGEIPRKRGKTNQRVCSPVDFRNKVVPELKPLQELVANIKGRESKLNYSTDKGIPQGLPISAVLANMYMLGADKNISTEIEQLGGSYRRYSDDILLIVPRGAGRAAEEVVTDVLNKFRLKTKDSKTNRVVCLSGNKTGRIKIDELDKTYANTGKTSMISYLGFSFDGKNISVKDGTISRFLTKASREINRAKIAAKKNKSSLKKRRLYARLSSMGYGQAYGDFVYQCEDNKWPSSIPQIGFFKYLRRAADVTGSTRIQLQIVQVDNLIFRKIDRAQKYLSSNG